MEKEKFEKLVIATSTLLSVAPYVGGPLSIILGEYVSGRKDERIIRFIEDMKTELSKRELEIVSDYVSHDEFLDIFENTLRRIIFERQEEKRLAYKNILVNSILTEGTSFDDTEEYQHYVSLFRLEHFRILNVFYEFKDLSEDKNRENRTKAIFALCSTKCKSQDEEVILEYIGDLEIYRLVDGYLADYNSMDGNGGVIRRDGSKITAKGERFYEYVLGEKKQ